MKHWKPPTPSVAVKPSRIRRDPVRLSGEPEAVEQRKLEPPSREEELYGGIAGILLFAAALAIAVVGISAATLFKDDPQADAEAQRFGQCYNGGTNCVVDGGTIYVRGERLAIAGLEVPRIQDAACDKERDTGIDAAVRLADLLNHGRVSVGPTVVDESGRAVRPVTVDGKDVAEAMIASHDAVETGNMHNWCPAG